MRVFNNIGKVFVRYLDKVLSWRYLSYISLIATIVTCFFFISNYFGKSKEEDTLFSELTTKINIVRAINNDKMINYVDTLSHIEQKRFLSIEDSLLLYVENLDELLDYDKNTQDYLNDSIDYYLKYSKKALSIYKLSMDMIQEVLLTYNNVSNETPPYYSQEKTSMLIYKANNWMDYAEGIIYIFDSISERSMGDKQEINNKKIMMLSNAFNIKEFFEFNLSFLDYMIYFDEKVKSMLIAEMNDNE